MMTRRIAMTATLALAVPHERDIAEIERRVFDEVNEVRERVGAGRLQWSAEIACAARLQSTRMMERGFFGHADPDRGQLADRLKTAGIPWSRCAENLLHGRGYTDPVRIAIISWWYSPGHRQNMIEPAFTESGIGVAFVPDETWFITQIFTTPVRKVR
jgi:uncharacterized protein YkwD